MPETGASQWIYTHPEEGAPRTGEGVFPMEVIEVTQVKIGAVAELITGVSVALPRFTLVIRQRIKRKRASSRTCIHFCVSVDVCRWYRRMVGLT